MREPLIATIGLGANLGDAQQAVQEAMQTIATFDYCQLHAASPLYRSAPVDSSGPDYFNVVSINGFGKGDKASWRVRDVTCMRDVHACMHACAAARTTTTAC